MITDSLKRLAAKGKLTEPQAARASAAIQTTTLYSSFGDADIVVEAATEDENRKVEIFRGIDQSVRPSAIIATNTSSISITKLASFVSNSERVVGMHFFNPVPLMSLVEIVRGLRTSDATFEAVTVFAKRLGKQTISVKNAPGFVVNRVLLPMINEAFFVLAEGEATPQDIDSGMKLGCNHPMGPLALADLIGLDVVLAVMDVFHRDFADSKYRPCPLLKEMVDAGDLGRKTGRGVYNY